MKDTIIFVLALAVLIPVYAGATEWENWELGGELGLALGSAGDNSRIFSPGIAATVTRTDVNPVMEFGLAYYFGSREGINYTLDDVEDYARGDEAEYAVIADADKDVLHRLSVVPFTLNFIYTVYDNFYIGGGIGMYNVWYRIEPLGDYRAYPDPDTEKGEMYSHTPTTSFGFQQIVGVEIFPVSENWNWFMGARSFLTSDTAAGRVLGITIGGKARYTW